MRSLVLVLIALVVGCGSVVPPGPPSAADVDLKPSVVRPAPQEASVPSPPAAVPAAVPAPAPRFVRAELGGIAIEAVVFDARSHRLEVADQPGGPGSKWPDCRAAGAALGGIAAVNAGFFTPEGAPLGRVVVRGQAIGAINRASSLGAGFFVESGGRLALVRRERFPTAGAEWALQSGPFLVENGRVVGGLSTKSATARTVVATDGRSGWILARTGGCSLLQLGNALAGRRLGGVRIEQALNLDGGRSSEIWASGSMAGGPEFTRPLWNKPVRNYLVVRARSE